MNDSTKKTEQEKMVQAGLISAEDTLIDGVRVNCIEGPLGLFAAQGWWAYFTSEKLVLFMGGALGYGKFSKKGIVIPYRNIKEIKNCPYMILLSGIAINYEDPETGALATEKIYIGPGGGKWKSFLEEKTGVRPA